MIYVVLGMHKSGTTLVSQALHESGINMGDFNDSLDYDSNNKYERHITQEINRMMLDGCLVPPLGYLLRARKRPLYDQAGYQRNKDSIALFRSAAFRRKYRHFTPAILQETVDRLSSTYEDWGFKDPRTCLTYPVWARVLPEHRLVIVYRHFSQLIERYRVSAWNLPRLYRVLYSWTIHNQQILRTFNQSDPPAVVLSYEQLMGSDEEYARLRSFVGGELVDVRVPGLYRRRTEHVNASFSRLIRLLTPLLPANPHRIYNQLESCRINQIL